MTSWSKVITFMAVVVTVMAAVCTSCGTRATKSMVVGNYTISHSYDRWNHGTETLQLLANGTYVQEFRPKGKHPKVRNTGRWAFEDTYGPHVRLWGYLHVPNPDASMQYPLEKLTMTGLPVEVWGGEVRLIRNPDFGMYYAKKP